MSRLEAALLEVSAILDELRIPYMLIGGLAVAQWEEPRATLDIDIAIWVEPDQLELTVRELCLRLAPKPKEPAAFVRETRVLPAVTSQGIPVDLIFAMWPMEREAIQNAVERTIAGKTFRVVPLEYLLFLKFTSDRGKDLDDAERLFRRHRVRIDSALMPGSRTPNPPACQIQLWPGCHLSTSSFQVTRSRRTLRVCRQRAAGATPCACCECQV